MPASRTATIGVFDGVHAGHRFLIRQLQDEAQRRQQAPLLITFDEHPAAILHPQTAPPLLTTTTERIALLQEQIGADHLLVLPFTPALAALTAKQFMQRLYHHHNVRTLILGYDHHFGHDRLTRFEDYQRLGQEIGIEVVRAKETLQKPSPSSSAIRQLLLAGCIENANDLLSYPYSLRGNVVDGFHIGRLLGYPTANVQPLSPRKLIPANGVYAVSITTPTAEHQAMLYIGKRPTFGTTEQTIEAHLFDFQGNLYGSQIEIQFRRFIREERTFNSPEELRQQLEQDQTRCR